MTTSELLAIYGIAPHMLGLATALPADRFRRVVWKNEIGGKIERKLSFEVAEFTFFGFWCAAVCLHSFE